MRLARTLVLPPLLFVTPAGATNFLVLVADDLGVDKVGVYASDSVYDTGSRSGTYVGDAEFLPATPTLDSLAAAGLRFTRAWASPMCTPTRASLQTGLFPSHLSEPEAGKSLDDGDAGLDPLSYTWLAAELSAGGYATGLFGKWHLGEEGSAGTTDWSATGVHFEDTHPARAGYDRFYGALGGYVENFSSWNAVSDTALSPRATVSAVSSYVATATTDAALAWINGRPGPWFAVVSWPLPHASEPDSHYYYTDVDPSCLTTPALAACVASGQAGGVGCVDGGGREQQALASYQGLVECLDSQVAALLGGMGTAALDDTVVIFVGDNGSPNVVGEGEFDASGRGKTTAFESGVRVPMMVTDGRAWRGGPGGAVVVAPGRTANINVHVLDVYQTVAELALGRSIGGVDSVSFADCLATPSPYCGRGTGPRGLTYEEYGYTETFHVADDGTLVRASAAVRFGPHYKLVLSTETSVGCLYHAMYDTTVDVFETTPLTEPAATKAALEARFTTMAPYWAEDPATGGVLPWCP